MKKFAVLGFIAVSVTVFLLGCGRADMDYENQSVSFHELSEMLENIEEVSLTIYYANTWIRTRFPWSVEFFLGGRYSNKIVIEGDELKEHIDFLQQIATRLSNGVLIPIEREAIEETRMYYIFETADGKQSFSVSMWGGSRNEDNTFTDVMFVNGEVVYRDNILIELALPFLSEDTANDFRRGLR
ncbi:MAG: hypothetical protein FWC89_11360 [Defluviitaleaceae bacterium]|nr:hypothetical protein [Defluviitaleaceae bacterium]